MDFKAYTLILREEERASKKSLLNRYLEEQEIFRDCTPEEVSPFEIEVNRNCTNLSKRAISRNDVIVKLDEEHAGVFEDKIIVDRTGENDACRLLRRERCKQEDVACSLSPTHRGLSKSLDEQQFSSMDQKFCNQIPDCDTNNALLNVPHIRRGSYQGYNRSSTPVEVSSVKTSNNDLLRPHFTGKGLSKQRKTRKASLPNPNFLSANFNKSSLVDNQSNKDLRKVKSSISLASLFDNPRSSELSRISEFPRKQRKSSLTSYVTTSNGFIDSCNKECTAEFDGERFITSSCRLPPIEDHKK